MLILKNSDPYSNYLKSASPETRIIDRRDERLKEAENVIREHPFLLEIMRRSGTALEEISLLVRDSSNAFSYLRYNKQSPVAVVLDGGIGNVLELLFDPSLADKAHMKATAEPDYTELVGAFFSAIPKLPTIEQMIRENESELYFIDTQKAVEKYFALQCRVFFDTLKQLDPGIGCSVYRQSMTELTVIAQNRYDLPNLHRDENLPILFEKEDKPVYRREEGNGLFLAAQNTPGVFDIIALNNTRHLDPPRRRAILLLTTALLNIWRLR